MKKHALILSVFVLSFVLGGFLGLNTNFANAANCASGDLFNTATGQPCSTNTTVIKCSTGHLFNSTTGERCTSWEDAKDTVVVDALFKRELTVGSKGEDVKALQQILKDSGLSVGRVDGSYGPMTKSAVMQYQRDNSITSTGKVDLDTLGKIKILPWYRICPLVKDSEGFDAVCPPIPEDPQSPVISGVSGPQTLDVNQQGTWTIKASSANGGNLSYSVVWGDENMDPSITVTTSSSKSPTVQSATFSHTYTKAGNYTPVFTVTSASTINCIKAPCPGNGGSAQTSLSVNVGNVATGVGNLSISPSSISITIKDSNTPVKAYYQSPMPPCPSGAMCMQMMPAIVEVDARWSVSNTNIAEVQYIGAACLGCKAHPVIQGVSVGTTELKATYTTTQGTTLTATAKVVVGGDTTSKNSAPKIVTSSTLTGGIQPGQAVSFSWTATDSDSDDLSWSVDWGDGIIPTSSCSMTRRQAGAGWSYSTSHAWEKAGTYQVKVTASDCVGGADSYSFSVRVGETIATP